MLKIITHKTTDAQAQIAIQRARDAQDARTLAEQDNERREYYREQSRHESIMEMDAEARDAEARDAYNEADEDLQDWRDE